MSIKKPFLVRFESDLQKVDKPTGSKREGRLSVDTDHQVLVRSSLPASIDERTNFESDLQEVDKPTDST